MIKDKIKNIAKKLFIDAFSGMAQGLFCTLIAGTILCQIATWIGKDGYFGGVLFIIGSIAKTLMGAGIGVGIAYALNGKKLVVFSTAVAGLVGAFSEGVRQNAFTLSLGSPGNPIGAYVVAVLTVVILSLYAGKTKLDILVVPLGALILCFVGVYIAYPFAFIVEKLGALISKATEITPFFMGIVIATLMGILLTLPTSSAAIWISVASGISDESMLIAGGAAVVGCACHMVGFAVSSYKENGVSGLISQGIGTSMLQIPNVMKKPIIMLPEIIASMILGPVSTCLVKLKCNASGGGMGTSGLVGVFGVIDESKDVGGFILAIEIALMLFILPAVLSFAVSYFMRKKGWIKEGDQKL